MTLTAQRPARSVSSLVADDPVELAADLPRLPRGVTLDLEVLRDAACGPEDLELFYPEPGDQAAEQAAKAICAACPVREACLDMALATGDQHAILGGTTPAERIPLRRQRQVIHAREKAAERATAATGIDPADIRGPVGRSMRAHLFGDASATVRAWELCKTAGTSHVAALIGVHVTDLHAALAHWGLEVPNLHKPAELVHDPAKAREAFALVEQVGWVKAAREVGVARRTLRAAFAQWGIGEPVHRGPRAPTRLATDRAAAEEALELAVQVGTSRAAERFGVNPATLYCAWKRWGLERPTDRPEGARRALERKLAAARRADPERHPWRRDRSIWQRRTPDRTADRTAERTAGHER
jgi:WhiB family transcriptional regulator, redox-sensing transcriptional regulator